MMVSAVALANDGGIAAIKVDQIKMRETAIKNGQEVIVQKITKPSFKIMIEGGEAAKLQQILPSMVSVVTSMNPAIAKDYNESFKALGIFSDNSAAAAGKFLEITCSDATLSLDGSKITKTGKSVCTITINSNAANEAADSFGDQQLFEPKVCK
jgi:hypothetical protein